MYPERQLTHAGLARDHRVTRPGQCVTLALPGRFDLSWGLNRLVGHLVVDASDFKGDTKTIDVWGRGVGQGQCHRGRIVVCVNPCSLSPRLRRRRRPYRWRGAALDHSGNCVRMSSTMTVAAAGADGALGENPARCVRSRPAELPRVPTRRAR